MIGLRQLINSVVQSEDQERLTHTSHRHEAPHSACLKPVALDLATHDLKKVGGLGSPFSFESYQPKQPKQLNIKKQK